VTAPPARQAGLPGPRDLVLRPAVDADVPACAALWRESLNDYMVRLNLHPIPDELGPIRRLHAHLHATDPGLFWIAEPAAATPPDASPQSIAFAAATRRDDVWFLSMLFVRPGEQGRGLGRGLLERILPADGATLATATDSAQPISNALYASLGIVPRMPLLNLVGRPDGPGAFDPLPAGVRAVPFESLADGPPGSDGHAVLVATVDALDREIAGFSHPQDHRWLRSEGRRGFLYQAADGSALGYGYAGEAGRVGPVAVRDEAMLPAVLGHLLEAVQPRGASAVWVPGEAGPAVTALLRAGLRLDGFPVLLCWTRPFADFSRYLPISPGLL
jgi:hypothetical protein